MLLTRESPCKQGYLLNDLRSLSIDNITLNEDRLSHLYVLYSYSVLTRFTYLCINKRLVKGGKTPLFWKNLDLKKMTILRDTEVKSEAHDVNNIDCDTFRLAAVYILFRQDNRISSDILTFTTRRRLGLQ